MACPLERIIPSARGNDIRNNEVVNVKDSCAGQGTTSKHIEMERERGGRRYNAEIRKENETKTCRVWANR